MVFFVGVVDDGDAGLRPIPSTRKPQIKPKPMYQADGRVSFIPAVISHASSLSRHHHTQYPVSHICDVVVFLYVMFFWGFFNVVANQCELSESGHRGELQIPTLNHSFVSFVIFVLLTT